MRSEPTPFLTSSRQSSVLRKKRKSQDPRKSFAQKTSLTSFFLFEQTIMNTYTTTSTDLESPHPEICGPHLPPGYVIPREALNLQGPDTSSPTQPADGSASDSGSSRPATDTSAAQTVTPPSARKLPLFERLQKSVLIGFILVVSGTVLLAFVGVPLLLYWSEGRQQIVRSVQPGGHVISVTLSQGFFTRSLVQTDLGFYALTEGVSLPKGAAVSLELRASSQRFLCDEQHRCTELL